jgi:4-diphosphocytidyl-2-C-methyl-D-erythritol kinase
VGTAVADFHSGGKEMLTLRAPAKLNLTLEVLGERGDGFHEIRSVIQTINLTDELTFHESGTIDFRSDSPGWIAEESLVARAVRLVQEAGGCAKGATIEVKKTIPLFSGLGGDSSDAAAVLQGLDRLWGLRLPKERSVELARQLGSDVAFFLSGGTAMVEGRGEIVTPLPPLPHRWVVLVMPAVATRPGKTRKLYESLKPRHYTDGSITERFIKELREGGDFTSLLFNTFENVAHDIFSELTVYREHILKVGATNVHLAGSGPTLFTIVEDKAQAEDLYLCLKQQNLETYLTDTASAVAGID